MRDKFIVTAFYYNQDNFKFRRYLEIKRKSIADTEIENDLNVIMMNPGSSSPLNRLEDENEYLNKFVEAHPDPTQHQIMQVMENCDLNYARVVNLSDIREPKSSAFYNLLKSDLQNVTHSIFQVENEDYLKSYFNPKAHFILGWGVNTKLKPLAKSAIERLNQIYGNEIKICGWQHPNNSLAYYHPYPRTNQAKLKWRDIITNQILNN